MQKLLITLMLLTVYESAGQVCSNSTVTYRLFYSSVLESYSQNYETSCGWFGWSTCRRTRILARTVMISMMRSMLNHTTFCCPGYNETPSNCQPICNEGCPNNGTCVAPNTCTEPCKPRLLAPQNGDIMCDRDQLTTATCNFTCDPGYSLAGSMERTCQPNNSWSGSNASCDIMLCEELQPPSNGILVLPCNREFQSVCNVTCEDGYYTEGPYTQSCELSDDGIVQWSTAPVCREITPCGPNPCQHNGRCVIVGDDDFSCDCSLTGYTGVTCNIGVLTVPSYPALTIGVTGTLTITAVPDSELIISIASSDTDVIIISPSTLTITNPASSAMFSIGANGSEVAGLYSISYTLSGVNADDYIIPSDSIVFVRPTPVMVNYFESRGLPNGQLSSAGCFMAPQSLQCQNGGQFNTYSTSQWSNDNNMIRTDGIVHLVNGRLSLLLAIAGANITVEQSLLTVERVYINLPVASENTDNCTSYVPSISDLDDFLRFKTLTTTFLSSTARLLPTWMQFMVTSNGLIDSSGDGAYLASVVTREELNNIAVCQNIITNDNTVHLVVRHDSNLTINVSGSQITHIPTDNSVVCFSVELCSQIMPLFHIDLPSGIDVLNQLQFMNDLANAGWRMDLDAVTFATSGNLVPVNMMETYWTGSSYRSVSFLGAHIGLRGLFTREFSDTATTVTFDLSGDVYWRVENLDQIFNDPLNQRWTGTANGNITIVVTLPFYGSNVSINFTAPLAYMRIGGLTHSVCPGDITDPTGIFVTASNSTFDVFADIFPPSGTGCQLNPYAYMNGNNLSFAGAQSNCSDLLLGELRFSGLTHYFVIVAGIDSNCNYSNFSTIANPSVLVESFIDVNTSYRLNDFLSYPPSTAGRIMRTSFSRDTINFSAVTEPAQINLLGDILIAPLSINNCSLSFSGNISLYDVHPSSVEGVAFVDQSFDSLEISLTGVVDNELVITFQNRINNYLEELVELANDRLAVSTTGLQRANSQLNASIADVNYQNETLIVATREYEQAIQQLETANRTYTSALKNVTEEILSVFDNVCEVKNCDVVCNAGLQCDNCQIFIEGLSKSLEERTCFIQVAERAAPFEKSEYCWSEVTSMQQLVFGNCLNYSCTLRTEFIPFQEFVQEECSVPLYIYETHDEGYSCTVAVDGDQNVYNVSQLCCSPSRCSTMSPDKECVQSNVACRLVRKMLSNTSNINLNALDAARKELSVAEILVEEKIILRDIQMKAYKQSLATLALVNVSILVLNESRILLQNEVLAGILPVINEVQRSGSTENIIMLQNITFSTITSSPQSLTVLPLTLVYSTFIDNIGTYTAEFDFSSMESSLTQLTQELVNRAANSFGGMLRRKRTTVQIDPNLEFFQQQCNSWITSRDYVNNIYQSLEQAVNSSGSTYSVNTTSDGSTIITGINTTALEVLNISINIDELYSQVILEDDYIALVNLTESVNTSINKLVDYIKFVTFINWQSGQDLQQNFSRGLTGLTCFDLTDCLASVSDILQQLVADLPPEFSSSNFDSFEEYASSFVMLGSATNITITAARGLVIPLYNLLNSNNVVMEYWCASPPNITEHPPSSVVTTINSTVTLRCNAISDVPVSYYWSKDGSTIDGTNSNTLTLQVDSMNDEGSYVCHATNHISVTQSAASNLDIQAPPMITEHPSNQEVYVGSDNGTMISCRASGDPTPGYQWYFRPTGGSDYVSLMNETSSVLSIDIPQLSHAGFYYCNASNPRGHVISNTASITILAKTIPLFYVNISLDVEVVNCNEMSGLENSNICRNISFINVTTFTDDVFNELFNTMDTITPLLSNYSISANVVQLFLQVLSRNVSSDAQSFREIAANTITAKNEIRNTLNFLKEIVSNETLQFTSGVYILEPVTGSLMISELAELCPLGQYLHSSNVICINCPPGSQGVTESTCAQCTIDTFQDQQGQVTCKSCPNGQGTYSTGAVECTDICAPGSYSTTGLSPCTLCPVNTYQSSQRSTLCIDCPPRTVTTFSGSTNCTEEIVTSVTPSVTITTDDVSDDGSSSAGAIAAGISVAVVVIIAIIVTVVVLVFWYRKRMEKFHVDESNQAALEVDNDLYGFDSKHEENNGTGQPEDHDAYDTLNEQRLEAAQADNPMYDSELRDVQVNPLHGNSNAQTASDEVYLNIETDTRKKPMDADTEYAYCKH